MHSVAEASLEAVAVEQREEEVEILLFAVVRGCGQQQEVARDLGEFFDRDDSVLVYFTSPPKKEADSLWASSQTIRS